MIDCAHKKMHMVDENTQNGWVINSLGIKGPKVWQANIPHTITVHL